jgi:hypothetical protein
VNIAAFKHVAGEDRETKATTTVTTHLSSNNRRKAFSAPSNKRQLNRSRWILAVRYRNYLLISCKFKAGGLGFET